ncbi:hypothetical protein QFZ32_000208 [Streptomyces canus]|nr:hypothetical protein [Streptomyces canus]
MICALVDSLEGDDYSMTSISGRHVAGDTGLERVMTARPAGGIPTGRDLIRNYGWYKGFS